MQEINDEINIVESLRLKTEESDIKQYLKSTLGGYTKNSVLGYLNILRKQQQTMADTFSNNQQVLFNEKENLKKANDALKNQLDRVESEYHSLSQSLQINKFGDGETSASDIIVLKNNMSGLEEELNKRNTEKSRLEKQIEQQKSSISSASMKLDQSGQELLSLKEMFKAEMLKSKDQSNTISRISSTIEEKDEEIKFLKSLISEGQLAELSSRVNDLTELLSSQAEVMERCNGENYLKSQTIELLTQKNYAQKQRVEELSKNLNELSYRNDKFMAANKTLTEQLESEYKKSIELIKERSGITMDKLATVRKLDEANSKLMLLELHLKKEISFEDTDNVYKNANETEKIKMEVL